VATGIRAELQKFAAFIAAFLPHVTGHIMAAPHEKAWKIRWFRGASVGASTICGDFLSASFATVLQRRGYYFIFLQGAARSAVTWVQGGAP
jgi:hypothetical protein